MNTSTNTTFRIFTPIILFNDTKEGLCIDNELLEIKKQKVNAMLKSNVQFWNHIIETTNNKSDDDDTTASSHSSTLDESPPILNKKKCNNGRRRRGNLPKNVTAILKQWLIDHRGHPYPTEEEKRSLRMKTNLTLNQISNWFINARRRILPLILSQEKKK